MKPTDLYLKLAQRVAKRNQYTCHMFGGYKDARAAYRDELRPADLDSVGNYIEEWWWSAPCGSPRPRMHHQNTYAHNARVIALLLAHEMAKSGDIAL